MGKFVLTDATINVDGSELSNDANSVAMDLPDDEVDVSSFKGGRFREFAKGLSDATVTVTFFNNYDAARSDDVLWPLKSSDEPFKFYVQPFDGAVDTDNPAYGMDALLYNYSPLGGGIGEASSSDVNFRNASSEGIQKFTVPGDLTTWLA